MTSKEKNKAKKLIGKMPYDGFLIGRTLRDMSCDNIILLMRNFKCSISTLEYKVLRANGLLR